MERPLTGAAGVMIVPGTNENAGRGDALEIAARDVTATRRAVGPTWYFVGHTGKVSIMERSTSNDNGVRGVRRHATYACAGRA